MVNYAGGCGSIRYVEAAAACSGAIVLEGAGDADVNGVYCPDGEHLGYPRWTKVGGVSMEDSIHIATGGPFTNWLVTSGGTYAADPLNAKAYSVFDTFTEPSPPDNTWITTVGGTAPEPTYGTAPGSGIAGLDSCSTSDLSDLTLLSMTFDDETQALRMDITTVAVGALCAGYDIRLTCEGETAMQALREAIVASGDDATIRVLMVTGADGECATDCDLTSVLDRMGATLVTDGTDTYVLVIAAPDPVAELDCDTAMVGAETFASASLSEAGDCGMSAWMVEESTITGGGDGGAFDEDGFTDGFNI